MRGGRDAHADAAKHGRRGERGSHPSSDSDERRERAESREQQPTAKQTPTNKKKRKKRILVEAPSQSIVLLLQQRRRARRHVWMQVEDDDEVRDESILGRTAAATKPCQPQGLLSRGAAPANHPRARSIHPHSCWLPLLPVSPRRCQPMLRAGVRRLSVCPIDALARCDDCAQHCDCKRSCDVQHIHSRHLTRHQSAAALSFSRIKSVSRSSLAIETLSKVSWRGANLCHLVGCEC